MTSWNFADVWEVVAAERACGAAIDQGEARLTWQELDRRADALAATLLGLGLGRQARVAQYLYNGPEYLESVFASFKAGLVPVNTNYRYGAEELVYLWEDADAEVVIFDAAFADRVAEVRDRVPGVRRWICVAGPAGPGGHQQGPAGPGGHQQGPAGPGGHQQGPAGPGGHQQSAPPWAMPYEEAVSATTAGPVRGPWGRRGDDLLFVYTGGTTGMPKGVMWRQDDLWSILNRSGELRYPEDGGLDDVQATLGAPSRHPRPRLLPGPPLMHGTALFTAMSVMTSGGSVVLLAGRSFSAAEALDVIARERVTQMTIVGDAFARPLLAELDAAPGRWNLSSLWLMVSSGVMWSEPVKAGLARHLPHLIMVDALSSSEAIGAGRSRSRRGETSATGGFQLGQDARVIAPDGRDIKAGSGQPGLLAVRGRAPVGYHKDPAKTAATFRLINGERWATPGDWATVNADGSLTLLGRGSMCINTGGEKVFPEEVEEALKTHPSVLDAAVVGVPDERFGEAVVAVIEVLSDAARPQGVLLDEAAIIGWVKERLAGYKAPKRVISVAAIGRAANGKVDYRRLRDLAMDRLDLGRP